MKRWRILARGAVPIRTHEVVFACMSCGTEALLPVLGLPLAQIESGIVFDIGRHAMPAVIQCRTCRRRYEAA